MPSWHSHHNRSILHVSRAQPSRGLKLETLRYQAGCPSHLSLPRGGQGPGRPWIRLAEVVLPHMRDTRFTSTTATNNLHEYEGAVLYEGVEVDDVNLPVPSYSC